MMKLFDINSYNISTELPSNSTHVRIHKATFKVPHAAPLLIKTVFTYWAMFEDGKASNLRNKNILPFLFFPSYGVNQVVMPYMAYGSIQDIIPRFLHGFKEKDLACLVKETVSGLQYLHNHGWLHKDVKPSNILVDDRKAAGIRLSFSFDPQNTTSLVVPPTHKHIDLPYWIPPEYYQPYYASQIAIVNRWPPQIGDKPCDPQLLKADIWSLGITTLEMAHGEPPITVLNPSSISVHSRLKCPTSNLTRTNQVPQFSQSYRDFVTQCLATKPEDRPSANELLQHPFLCPDNVASVKSLVSRISKVCKYDMPPVTKWFLGKDFKLGATLG